MKKLIFLSVICLIAGCARQDDLLRNAERQIKRYLDYPSSYRRIEWRITDTIFRNEMIFESLREPLGIQEEKLRALSENWYGMELKLKGKREDLAKCVNGRWVYPAAQQATGTAQRPVMITVLEEDIRSEINDILLDSANLAAEITRISFSRDSTEKAMANLSSEGSDISQIRMEIRFRARINSETQGAFMTKLMYLYPQDEFEIRDTFYDGLRLRYPAD